MFIIKIRDLIKKLAKESLDNKWYEIRKSESDGILVADSIYESNCAFCIFSKDLRDKQKVYNSYCSKCPIRKLSICNSVVMIERLGDSSILVEAMEQLAENGNLTKEMIQNLKDFKNEDMVN